MSDILVSMSDVLDMITEIYEDGGFTDYAYYSRLWDMVDVNLHTYRLCLRSDLHGDSIHKFR